MANRLDGRATLWTALRYGGWPTRISFAVMGFGCLWRGQWLRGGMFLLAQAAFSAYMLRAGIPCLLKLPTLGTVETALQGRLTVYGDNSFLILLYSVLTVFLLLGHGWLWKQNVLHAFAAQRLHKAGRHPAGAREDLASLGDERLHGTLLALPTAGIFFFTVLPIVFMALAALTNYDYDHQPPGQLFTWVGWQNFAALFSKGGEGFGGTFFTVLRWTLAWAFFATFLNYVLGMLAALLIASKAVKWKRAWRTVLVTTIAVPQFISLLFVAKLFEPDGLVNACLLQWGLIDQALPFWTEAAWARCMVILINLWVGVPHMMLIITGVLSSIDAPLYEAARMDGAGPVQAFFHITLPHVARMTGPFLITAFTGNINNFNVIYLLTQGRPLSLAMQGHAGYTDLLITWLYKMTVTDSNFKLAAAIGMLVFFVTAALNLAAYNLLPSVRREEEWG